MKILYKTLTAGIIFSAFFTFSPLRAEEQACDPVTQESVLTKGIHESPELLMKILEGAELQKFWRLLQDKGWMVGIVQVDKVYVFLSENHPDWVYVYFLDHGCIRDVKFTFKTIISELDK